MLRALWPPFGGILLGLGTWVGPFSRSEARGPPGLPCGPRAPQAQNAQVFLKGSNDHSRVKTPLRRTTYIGLLCDPSCSATRLCMRAWTRARHLLGMMVVWLSGPGLNKIYVFLNCWVLFWGPKHADTRHFKLSVPEKDLARLVP